MISKYYLICIFTFSMFLTLPCYSQEFVRDDLITDPKPEHFSVCHNGTCNQVQQISLNQTQWHSIIKHLKKNHKSASEERHLISKSIAIFEEIIGPITGTDKDKAGNLKGFFKRGQMDCIDEATNTMFYLMMFKKAGLIQWHSIENQATRYYSLFTIPHTTAVLKETATGHKFAVDSWFRDNGNKADIVPLKHWRRGWTPKTSHKFNKQ